MMPLPAACTTCGNPLTPGSDRCTRCGTLHGDHRRCYGCGAKAEVIRKDGLVYVCAACGRPRVPMEKPGVPRSGREMEALARVEAARKDAVIATGLGIGALVIDAPILFLGAIFAIVGWTFLTLATFGVGAVLAVVALMALLSTAKKAKARANDAMRDALGAVALDVMRAQGTTTSRALAEQLGVPEQVADAALERLPARDDVRVETVVDEKAADGLVRYRVAEDHTVPAEALESQDAEQANFDKRLQASIRAKTQGK